ncbi:putative cell wall-binding protein [Desulfitobacterium sp. LBE]|uniref:DUF4073 domain-containing protein n=1 Tax=Desulfitobacterium sp. LBE TaxID=884086 RepID=UPI00119AE4C1|nr:DUF4073 domain-containing protein [Desulfitobacterium sp. LBE]TWH57208.1 putative cell wall-binding protein [Desulfitobacterium sp. LBE]
MTKEGNKRRGKGTRGLVSVILSLLLLLQGFMGSTPVYAAPPSFINVKAMETTSNCTAQGGATDSAGNSYVVGKFTDHVASGSVDFGGTILTKSDGSLNTIFVAKYAPTGALVWAKAIGSPKQSPYYGDVGTSIKVDSSGNVFIGGTFFGELDVDQDGIYELSGNQTYTTGFIAKFDMNGNYQWSIGIAGSAASSVTRLAVDSSGNVYTTGIYTGSATVTGRDGTSAAFTEGAGKNIYVMKLNNNGNIVWSVTGQNLGGDPSALGIAANDSTGDVYATGTFYKMNIGGTLYNRLGTIGMDSYILKISSAGTLQWFKTMASTNGNEHIAQVAVDSSGNLIVVGDFSAPAASFDIDPGTGTTSLTGNGVDGFVAKLDPSGDLVWYKLATGTGSGSEMVTRVFLDTMDNIYAAGTINIAGTHSIDGESLVCAGNTDAFLWKLNSSGTTQWVKSVGGSGEDSFVDVEMAPNNEARVILKISDTADVDPGPAIQNAVTSDVNKMAFVIATWSASGELAAFLSANLGGDATLKASPTVKGQTVTDLGTPNGALAFAGAGSVTLSAEQAADTSNAGSYVTLFDKNDSNATVKVVKYALGASPDEAAVTNAAPYEDEAISDGDFFIIKVVAQDGTTTLYYRVNVTVTPESTNAGSQVFTFDLDKGSEEFLTPTHAQWTEGGYTLDISVTGAGAPPEDGMVGSANFDGESWFVSNVNHRGPIELTVFIPGKIFDLESFDLYNQVADITGPGSDYVVSTNKGGSASGSIASTLGNATYKLLNFSGTGFTGISSFTLTYTGVSSDAAVYSIDNLDLRNITDLTTDPLSNDASLDSVLDQSITAGGEAGIIGAPKTASINVAHAKAELGLSDIGAAANATAQLYSDVDFTQEVTGSFTLALTAGGATTAYIKVTAQDGTTVQYYAVTVNRAAALSNDAGMATLAGTAITAGNQAGTKEVPKTASVNVAHAKSSIGLTDIGAAANATAQLYTDADFSQEVTGSSTLALTSGGATPAYIKVTAQDGTTVQYYAVTVNRAAALSNDASIATIAGEAVTAGSEAGTLEAPKTASISVANAKAELGLSDIGAAANATVNLYTDAEFTQEITGSSTLALIEGGATPAYIKVTAQDETTIKYYAVTISREAALSNDATLKAFPTVKGQTVTDLGTSHAALASVVAGSVTLTAAQAADTSNTGSYVTLFDSNDSNATVKVVKYASGASPDEAAFTGAAPYGNEAISNGDFFIIKVVAQDESTTLYYKVNATVTFTPSETRQEISPTVVFDKHGYATITNVPVIPSEYTLVYVVDFGDCEDYTNIADVNAGVWWLGTTTPLELINAGGSWYIDNGNYKAFGTYSEGSQIDIRSGSKSLLLTVVRYQDYGNIPGLQPWIYGAYLCAIPQRITYNLNGGNIDGDTAAKTEYLFNGDTLATTFNAPTKGDSPFKGWYTAGTGGSKVTSATNSSATYYAQWEDKLPVNNTAGAATVAYAGTEIDLTAVSGLFTVDSSAGAQTFTIEEGGTGAGTISGNLLTVTEAGTIEIGLTTAETSTHQAGAKITATITVDKGTQDVPAGLGKTDAGSYGGSDGKITGLIPNRLYEHKKDGGAYTAVTANTSGEITGLSAGTYVVRLAGNDLYHAGSDSAEIIIGQATQPGVLAFSNAAYTIGEGGGSVTITVTRTGGSDGAVSVDYATSDGTATAGTDYTAASGTLSFADGDAASKTFTVAIIQDAILEGNETVNLTLSNAAGGAALGQSSATLTIMDDEVASPNVTANDLTNQITGADNTMEYSTNGGTTWTAYDSANPPIFTGNQTVQVRIKASGSNPAGPATTLTFTVNLSEDAAVTAKATSYNISGNTIQSNTAVIHTDVTVESFLGNLNKHENAAWKIVPEGTPMASPTDFANATAKAAAAKLAKGDKLAVLAEDGVTLKAYAIVLTESNDAGIATLAGTAITAGTEAGTKEAPKTASVNVAHAKASIGLTDIGAAANATVKLYTNAAFTQEVTGSSTLALTSGGATTAYIKVTAQDGTTVQYYAVTINRAADSRNDDDDDSSPSTPAPTPTQPTTPANPAAIPVNVTDSHANSTTKTINAQITNDSNGTKTLSFKSQEAILEKKPDGTRTEFGNLDKVGFTPDQGTASSISLSADGTIQVKNLANGTESQFKVTFDLGNGQKIAIGRIEVKVDKDGAISLTSTLIDPYGIILDSATNQPITGVDVKLYYADTARNRAGGKTPDTLVALPTLTGFEPNDNANPQVSNSYGAYAYMVFPQSDYYLLATQAGYERYKSPIITVEQDIVKWDFKMHQSLSGVQRLFGSNRVETAIAIAQANYSGKVANVVLATANNYPDALAGSVLAYKLNAPLLLVGSTAQDQESLLNYLKEHVETAGTITILGGTGAVPAAVEETIQAHGYSQIIRLGGANRYETALKIAEELKVEQGRPVILAYGGNYPDALSVSSAAAAIQSPILLVEKNGISEGVKNKLAQIKPIKVYIIGLEGVISQQVEDEVAQLTSLKQENIVRIGGVDRYQTSLAVAKYFNLSGKNIGIATGNNFPDALAGSVYAANHNAPILLLNDTIPNDVIDYLKSREMTGATIFGGEAVINAEIEQKLKELIK